MGVVERSREVMAVMALHEALRNVCVNSDWTYSVFWTIRPRPRLRGGLGCKAGEEGSLMLMWEDGYCRPAGACSADAGQTQENEALVSNLHRVQSSMNLGDDVEEEDPVRKAFRKMSIQLYNYGEGLMGKVASDKCHKWVFRESSENETGPLNYWQSSFDSHPPEWMDQFSAGIQTIAVIQAGHGLLQLGSCKIVAEDLHFVLRMRYTFESLENQAGGGFLSQTFAPMRNRFFCSSPTGASPAQNVATPGNAGWQNASPYFAGSSEFRLRLGLSGDIGAMNGHQQPPEENNITSLRLSLQNGSDRFEFQNGDHFAPGMKRPATSGNTDMLVGKSNLLARRMHFNKPGAAQNGHPTFQELLQAGTAGYPNGVFLGAAVPATEHDGLMVQIPPVFPTHNSSANHTPLVSPVGSNKVQRTSSNVSPMIQSALQEAIERASRSNCSSPLPVRVHKQENSFVTPKQELGTPSTPKDNPMNASGCFVSSAQDGESSGHGKVQVSTVAVWENLKESLELPPGSTSNRRPASGEMYPDFMDGFFE